MERSEFIFTSSEAGGLNHYDAYDHTKMAVLSKVHVGEIYCIAASKNGQFLATSDNLGTIKLFNPTSTKSLTIFNEAHDDSIDVLGFDNESLWLYSGGANGRMKKWCMKSKKLAEDYTNAHQRATILSMAFTDDVMFTGDGVGVMKLWSIFHAGSEHDTNVCDVIKALRSVTCLLDMGPSHPRGIQTMKLSNDNKVLFTADDGGYIKQWDIQEAKNGICSLLHNFGNIMKGCVGAMVIDSNNLWVPNEYGIVKQFNIETKKLVKIHTVMEGTYIECGVMNFTEDKIWWANNQGCLICWCPKTGSILKNYGKIHNSAIHSMTYVKK